MADRFTPTSVGTAIIGRGMHHIIVVHPHERGDSRRRNSARKSVQVHPHERGDSP